MQPFAAIDIATLLNFSHQNCVAICAFLVPATIFITGYTTWALLRKASPARLHLSAAVASISALLLLLHVSSWFIIGVITPVTFILTGLGTTCLLVNGTAVAIAPRFRLAS